MKRPWNSPEKKLYYARHLVPVTVWLAAVVIILWLFHVRSERFVVVGIARGQIRQIASDAPGRIQKVDVELFQQVKAGQPLAVVDTLLDNQQLLEVELKAQLNTATAEIEHLTAQLVPTQEDLLLKASDLQMSRANDERQFYVDVERAQLEILGLQVTIATDQIAANGLEMKVKSCQELLEDGIIAPAELEAARIERDGMDAKIRENEQLLERARATLKEAELRCTQFAKKELRLPAVEPALEVIRKEINVQEETVNGLLSRLEALKSRRTVQLTAPIDGRIVPIPLEGRSRESLEQRAGEQVVRRPGEVVAAGDPILAVAEETPTEVVAYIGEQAIGHVRKDMPVDLVKTRAPAQIAKTNISAVGPTIELMPQRLWRSPTVPQWGLPVVIEIPRGLQLVPGEVVGVRGL